MEGVRGSWKRRGYRRLRVLSGDPRLAAAMRFRSRRPRLSWPRLNLLKIVRSISPKKWLATLRDAYVDMMLRWSRSRAFATGTIADAGVAAFRNAPLKEYDQKVIVELYRSILLAQSQGKAAAEAVVRIPSRVPEEIEV